MDTEEEGFFEHGKVILKASDYSTGMVECQICMPCCLMQTVTPHLLNGGTINNLRIREPLAIWLPKFSREHLHEFTASIEGVEEKLYVAMKEEILRVSRIFVTLQNYLKDPSGAIPMLPLGVYIVFEYRCVVDKIMDILVGIEGIQVEGITEFQWALAGVLKTALMDFKRVNINSRLPHILP